MEEESSDSKIIMVSSCTLNHFKWGWFLGLLKGQVAVWFVLVCSWWIFPSFCGCCFDQHHPFKGIEMMVVSVFLPPMFGDTNFENCFFGGLFSFQTFTVHHHFMARMFIPYVLGEDSHLMTTISLVEMMQFHQHCFFFFWRVMKNPPS